MSVLIACDGSSLTSLDGVVGKGPIGWAWARDDGHWYANGSVMGTNQRAELLGILSVLIMHPKEDIVVQLDSKYALNTVESWMWGWAKKGWIKSDGNEVLNLDIVKKIYEIYPTRSGRIDLEWVKGHDKNNSHPLNTKADVLANTTSNKIKDALRNNVDVYNFYSDSKDRNFHPSEDKHISSFIENSLTVFRKEYL